MGRTNNVNEFAI